MSRWSLQFVFAIVFVIIFNISAVFAGTITLSLGEYDTSVYLEETITIPVTVVSSNVTGTITLVMEDRVGLSCGDECTKQVSVSGGTNEQNSVSYTLTGSQTGTYNPPFISLAASAGSDSATPITDGASVVVSNLPTWDLTLSADDSTVSSGDTFQVDLTISPTNTFSGVSAELDVPSGYSIVSGDNPKSVGTVTGDSTVSWIVEAGSSDGTVSVQVSASDPTMSGSENEEEIDITIETAGVSNPGSSTSGGGGGSGGGSSGGLGSSLSKSPQVNRVFALINEQTPARFLVGSSAIPVQQFDISVRKAFRQATVSIGTLQATAVPNKESIPVFYKPIEFFEINHTGVPNEDITNVKFLLRLDNRSVSATSEVFLLRFVNGKWEGYGLLYNKSGSGYHYFTADVRGLSTFAVVKKDAKFAQGNPLVEDLMETTNAELPFDDGGEDVVEPETGETVEDEQPLYRDTTLWILLGLGIIILLIVGFVYYRHKKHYGSL